MVVFRQFVNYTGHCKNILPCLHTTVLSEPGNYSNRYKHLHMTELAGLFMQITKLYIDFNMTSQLVLFINLQRAVIGPSATLTGR